MMEKEMNEMKPICWLLEPESGKWKGKCKRVVRKRQQGGKNIKKRSDKYKTEKGKERNQKSWKQLRFIRN